MAIVTAHEKKLNNIWCWLYIIISIAPLIFWEELLIAFSSDEEFVISTVMGLAVTIVFIVLDRRALSTVGLSAPHPLWGFFLPPVYFYKRANITGARRKYMFCIITLVYIAISLVILIGSIVYAVITIHIEQEVCEFLNTRTEQMYGQAGLNIRACESVSFDIMDYIDDESDSPFRTDVLLKNGETIQMDVQTLPDGNVRIVSPYPW